MYFAEYGRRIRRRSIKRCRASSAAASAAGRGEEEGRAGTRVGRGGGGRGESRDAGRFENGTIGRSAKVGGIRRDCLREQGDRWRQTAAACLDLALARSPALSLLSLSSLLASLLVSTYVYGSIRCMHVYAPTCPTWFAILLIYFGARSLSLSLSLCCLLWTSVVVPPSADDRSKCVVGLASRESRAWKKTLVAELNFRDSHDRFWKYLNLIIFINRAVSEKLCFYE